MVSPAELVKIRQSHIRGYRQRVGDHAGFAALNNIDLVRLVFNAQIAVKDTDTAVTGHSNSHL